MNFMGYGKATGSRAIGVPSIPVSRNTYIPEKYWTHSKTNNRHDIFFKPQQEDLEECRNKQKTRLREQTNDTLLTIKATSFFNREESSLYLVITEGRGNASCEVGLAAIDIKRPELILSQISDNFWYTGLLTKIAILSPAEILLPQALIDSNNRSKLYLYIKHTYPDLPIKAVPRRQFNDKKALEIIDRIYNSKYKSIRNMIAKKYYALTASSALLQYLEYILNYNFAPNSLKIRYESNYGCMMIDLDTSHHLELLYPTCKTKEKKSSLFGVLNFCVTNIGKRNLRAQILQPSCELKQITKTQECIKELFGNQELFVALERSLLKFQSVDKLMKFAIINVGSDVANSSETMITQALQLKTCLENVPELEHLLSTINNSYFDDVKLVLSNDSYKEMLAQINRVIHPDIQIKSGATQFFQRLHAINLNISSYLDLNRNNYAKLVDKMNDIIGNLSITYNLPFRMKFVTSKGFHIQLSISKGGQLPSLHSSFEVLSKTKNTINLTTNELRMLNMRMFDVVQQIHVESNRIITELINSIRQNMSHLYDLCGLISSLDIILSLAKYSINSNGCCPSFGSEMNVIDGVHPLLEYNRTNTTPIPNGVIANSEYHFFIITGPNMGGKTVYLKMIAILQIIAQLGGFVPAKSAQFRLTDKILSRIGFGDRIECNLSGFVLEMRETEYIFKNITPNSLVIIDELCRSTNPEEGEVLAWDICERFIRLIGVSNDGEYFDESEVPVTSKASNKSLNICSITSPFIFFVTHFDSITKLQDKFLSVVNLHFSANEEVIDGKTHLSYTYRIEDGVNRIKNYGISLAQYMNFPSDVITSAISISEQLRQEQLPTKNRNKSNFLFNNSSTNKRSMHRSTLLESSTSEQSHILRLFYNLFADIVSINRMNDISVEEKTELLNRKMRELMEDLPSHVLEMAKKGTLSEMFKRPPCTSPKVHTFPVPMKINEELRYDYIDPDVSQLLENSETHDSTNFSLLSEHSIARRISLELRDMYNKRTPPSQLSNSKAETSLSQRQHYEPSFCGNEIDNEMQSVLSDLESNFDNNEFVASTDDPHLNVMERETDFIAPHMDFMAQELTQYFSNLSPKDDSLVAGDEPNMEDFFNDSQFKDKSSMASMSNDHSDKFRSHSGSTKLKPCLSLKDNTKSKSISTNNSHKSSSSSSSGLFRLQLKEPVKVRDNRILKTPKKRLPRIYTPTKREITFRDMNEKTIEHPSNFDLNFGLFDDDETPFIVQVPSIGSSRFATEDSSHQKTFNLNLTQYCSTESADERPFFDSTKDVFGCDRRKPMSSKLQNDIIPIATSSPRFDNNHQNRHISNPIIPDQDDFTLEFGRNMSHQLKNVINPNVTQDTQEYSRDLFDLTDTLEYCSGTVHQSHQLKSRFNYNQFVTPNVIRSSALQFIQHAYESQSDNEPSTDSGASEDCFVEPSIIQPVTVNAECQGTTFINKFVKNSQKSNGSQLIPNITVPRVDAIGYNVVEDTPMSQLRKVITETEALENTNENVSLEQIKENLNDLILPVPSQFL